MTTLFTIDLETNDLSQFTSSATGGGDLSVAAGAALHGSYGLNVLINDTANKYGQKDITKSTTIRYRFYFDPNSLTMGNNEAFTLAMIYQAGGTYIRLTDIKFSYLTASGYWFTCNAYNDVPAAAFTDTKNITDASHYVEVQLTRAATNVSSDGAIEWWVDGVSQGSATNIDNYDLMQTYNWKMQIGACADLDAGTSGTMYIDDLQANDDGGVIGAIITSAAVSIYMNQYRQRRA
jgi:hypothetical protein